MLRPGILWLMDSGCTRLQEHMRIWLLISGVCFCQVWTGTIIGIFSGAWYLYRIISSLPSSEIRATLVLIGILDRTGAISYYVGEGLPCFGYDPCLTTEQLWCAIRQWCRSSCRPACVALHGCPHC